MAVVYRRPSRLGGIESLTARRDSTRWRLLHRHFEIVCVYAGGAIEARVARQEACTGVRYVDVVPETFNVLEPGDFHETVRQQAPSNFQVLLLDPQYVLELLPEVHRLDQIHFKPAVLPLTPHFRALCFRMHALVAQDSEQLELEEATALLWAKAVQTAGEIELRRRMRPERHPDPVRVQTVVDYLQEHCARPLALRRLASLVDHDQFRLLRAFKRVTGLTPYAYALQLRIARARARIARGEPIAEVALASGFCDQSHFHRRFKAVLGVTPHEYAIAGRRG